MLRGEVFSRTDDDNEEPETDTPGFGSLCTLTSEPTFVITESVSYTHLTLPTSSYV